MWLGTLCDSRRLAKHVQILQKVTHEKAELCAKSICADRAADAREAETGAGPAQFGKVHLEERCDGRNEAKCGACHVSLVKVFGVVSVCGEAASVFAKFAPHVQRSAFMCRAEFRS